MADGGITKYTEEVVYSIVSRSLPFFLLWWEDGNIKLMIQDGRSQATQAESQLLIGSSIEN